MKEKAECFAYYSDEGRLSASPSGGADKIFIGVTSSGSVRIFSRSQKVNVSFFAKF